MDHPADRTSGDRPQMRCLIGAAHDAVKRIARLSSRIYVATGESKIVCTEGICRIGLLGGDEATTRPLRASVRTRKHHRADYPIAVHYRAPFLVAEPAVCSLSLFDRAGQCCLELVVVRNLRAVLRVLRRGKGTKRQKRRESSCT